MLTCITTIYNLHTLFVNKLETNPFYYYRSKCWLLEKQYSETSKQSHTTNKRHNHMLSHFSCQSLLPVALSQSLALCDRSLMTHRFPRNASKSTKKNSIRELFCTSVWNYWRFIPWKRYILLRTGEKQN